MLQGECVVGLAVGLGAVIPVMAVCGDLAGLAKKRASPRPGAGQEAREAGWHQLWEKESHT